MAAGPVRAAFVLAALALAAVGCGDDGATSRSGGDELLGAWTVESLQTGSTVEPVDDGAELTAEFAGDRVSGNGGCNTFSAGYRTGGATIEIEPIAATLIACEDPALGEQEQRYFAALEAAETFEVRDGRLVLLDSDDATVVTFDRRAG